MQAETLNTISIYIDIDSLFDTRLAVLHKQGDVAVADVLKDLKYYNRLSDNFDLLSDKVDDAKYKRDWLARGKDASIREHFRITKMGSELEDIDGALFETKALSSKVEDYYYTINVYPYEFTKKETDAIVANVSRLVTGKVNLINVAPNKLDGNVLQSYNNVIMYDFDLWLLYNAEVLSSGVLKHSDFMIPYITPFKEIDGKPLNEVMSLDHMSAQRKFFNNLISLVYRPIDVFCY